MKRIGAILAATILSGVPAYATSVDEKPAGFEEITRAEMIQRAGDKFDQLDLNKDGILTKTEFKAYGEFKKIEREKDKEPSIKPNLERPSESDHPVAKRIEDHKETVHKHLMAAVMDVDNDGVVSEREWLDAAEKREARMEAALTDAGQEAASAKFKLLDVNGDGVLDMSELKASHKEKHKPDEAKVETK